MKQDLVKRIAESEATPAYVFDVDILKERLHFIRQKLGSNQNIELCYAMKANPFLVKVLEPLIEKYEVCSPGELSICRKKDIDMGKIVMSGVNKEKEDVDQALAWGVSTFTIESRAQLKLIQKCAATQNKTVEVLLRLTSGNQFGMDKADVLDIIGHREESPNLTVKGIQYYSCTQKKTKKIKEEIESLCNFCQELKTQNYDCFEAEKLEYGPGFGIDYFGKNENADTVLEECRETFGKVTEMGLHLTLEMGRFLVADCGNYLTKVMDVKENNNRKYCIVDGGINHVNYFGQVMGVRVPPVKYYPVSDGYEKESAIDQDTESICVCGSLCTVEDVLIRNITIANVQAGDLFVFEKIGAYSVTEGIYLFLSRKMPKIYLLQDDKLELLRDFCETYQFNIG